MTAFYELDTHAKSLILVMLYLLHLCQYAYVMLLFYFGKKTKGMRNTVPTLLTFLSLALLTRSLRHDDGVLGDVPVAAIWLIWIALLICTVMGIRHQVSLGRKTLSVSSVKESVDQLPGGLAFFGENGLLVLGNTKMQELFFQKTGRDLQTLSEMESLLKEEAVLSLPDGSIWQFERSEVSVSGDQHYTQYSAADLTALYRLRGKIDQDNEKMQVLIRQVRSITENVADITREEEILTAKMRLHNKMGSCMLAVRQYLRTDHPHTQEEKQQLIRLWKENLVELENEAAPADEPDAYEMVVHIARNMGLEVVLHGAIPENRKHAALITAALRECVTNALNHAGAKRLDLTVIRTDTQTIASFTNDGKQPEGDIPEGGGLSSLRAKIEAAGGEMEVTGEPVFLLSVTLPQLQQDWIVGAADGISP